MSEKTKSTIRHILTAFGAVLSFIGLGKYVGLTDILVTSLDGLWQAGSFVVGVALSIWGFFKDKARFDART